MGFGFDEMMVLNEVTGIVHTYRGTGHSGPMWCDCDHVQTIAEYNEDRLVAIDREMAEDGIWEMGDCVTEDEDG